MTPAGFITKWRASELKERSAAQEHFIDLCRLLGEPTPAEADPAGDHYCFERGAIKHSGGGGWADGEEYVSDGPTVLTGRSFSRASLKRRRSGVGRVGRGAG